MRAFRLVKAKYKDEVLSGLGASFRLGARWNEPGQRAVYSAENRALAILESLAHVPRFKGLPPYVLCEIEIADAHLEQPSDAPDPVDAASALAYGSRWFREARSVALAVPSVVISQERNLVLNVAHADFTSAVRLIAAVDYAIDERISSLLGVS